MDEYKCQRCSKLFSRKFNYNVHLNKKFLCNSNAPDFTLNAPFLGAENYLKNNKNNKKNIYSCDYCGKTFTRTNNLQRHIDNSCLIKKDEDNKKCAQEKDLIYTKLIEEMNELKSKMEILEKDNINKKKSCKKIINKNNINNTNSNNTNTNININNNINMVAFGTEELENIVCDKMCKKILFKGFRAVINLVEYIHFNKNKPEYHNCYISNMRDKYANIYDGKQWKLSETDEIINTLREDKKLFLENKFEEFYDIVDAKTKEKFNNFLLEAETSNVISQFKNEVRLLLYNNKGIIMETKKKIIENTIT